MPIPCLFSSSNLVKENIFLRCCCFARWWLRAAKKIHKKVIFFLVNWEKFSVTENVIFREMKIEFQHSILFNFEFHLNSMTCSFSEKKRTNNFHENNSSKHILIENVLFHVTIARLLDKNWELFLVAIFLSFFVQAGIWIHSTIHFDQRKLRSIQL